ncbi:hypothetical protein GCM10023314_15140 [Algibacter agarivorans]|uniref:Glycosyltransferase 2-like domain-containing protein n=1 Tax=Algibacter agarivorans TaxID=1109741 RepID=A0ABP9GGW2_9FLAO
MKVYVIIATYNGKKWIEECLTSVLFSSISITIILVDNFSNDDTVQLINLKFKKLIHLKKLILIEQKENLGFGKANNIGVSYALSKDADFVFLLNQDAYLQQDTISELIKVHKSNKDYGIISPIHLNGDGSRLDQNFSNYLKANNSIIFDVLQQNYGKTIYQVPFVNAAAWLLPRKTIEKIGGFDPIFLHYGEDDNYCQRILFHNLKIGVSPYAYVYHDRENSNKVKDKSEKEKLIFKERYYKYKWANINIEVKRDIKQHKNKLQKLILKLLIKFKFKEAIYYKKELSLINHILPEIFNSRRINSKKGKHYL